MLAAVSLVALAPVARSASFDRIFDLQGIRFHVASTDEGSINTLRIVPAGLEIDNSAIVRKIDGTVTGAEVADLNGDGSPEIYVYVSTASASGWPTGSLLANRRKSLSEVYLPPLTEDKVAAMGYMGHDVFSVVDSYLVRCFPVYRETDTNSKPTGGTHHLQYQLTRGEAGWILNLDRTVLHR